MSFRQAGALTGFGIGGAGLLGRSLSRPPGTRAFYALTAGVAGAWTAGTVLSGVRPPLWGDTPKDARPRAVATAALVGVGAFGAFYGLAHVARRSPWLQGAIRDALIYERQGSTPLVVLLAAINAAAEELFFRGALWAVTAESRPIAETTLAYTAATAATGNPALVLAGGVMGLVFGYQRQATGGIVAPTVSHVTWAALMLRFLPPLFAPAASGDPPS
jgi:uncharacterized protein